MEPLVLSTEGIPAREQLELWRGLGDRLISCPRRGSARSVGRAVPRRHAGPAARRARFVDLRSEGHRIRPGAAAAAARATADVCIVEQEIVGPASYTLGGRPLACRPGDLWSTRPTPGLEEHEPSRLGHAHLDHPAAAASLPLLPGRGRGPSLHIPPTRRGGGARGRRGRGPGRAGGPARARGRRAARRRLLPPARDRGRRRPGAVEGGREALRAAALERARRHVDRHLTTPCLGSASAARAVGVSERQLQLLFERTGESSAATCCRRLEEVCAALVQAGRRPGHRPGARLGLRQPDRLLPRLPPGLRRAARRAAGRERAAGASLRAPFLRWNGNWSATDGKRPRPAGRIGASSSTSPASRGRRSASETGHAPPPPRYPSPPPRWRSRRSSARPHPRVRP